MAKKGVKELTVNKAVDQAWQELWNNNLIKAKELLVSKVTFDEFINYLPGHMDSERLKFLSEIYPNPNWSEYVRLCIKTVNEKIPFLQFAKETDLDLSKQNDKGFSLLAQVLRSSSRSYFNDEEMKKIISNIEQKSFKTELDGSTDEKNAGIILINRLVSHPHARPAIEEISSTLNFIVDGSPNASKFYSYLLTNQNIFSDIIYKLDEKNIDTFIELNKKHLTEDLVNVILSNNVLLKTFNTKEMSQSLFDKGMKLISENKFTPIINALPEEFQDAIDRGSVDNPHLLGRNTQLYLEMVKANTLSIEKANNPDSGRYTAFERVLVRGLENIPSEAQKSAYNKRGKENNSEQNRMSGFKRPSSDDMKEAVMEETKKLVDAVNKFIDVGFEPKINNNTKETIQKLFDNNIKYSNPYERMGFGGGKFSQEALELSEELHMPPDIAEGLIKFFDKRYGFTPKAEVAPPQDPVKVKFEADTMAAWNALLNKLVKNQPEEKLEENKKSKPTP